MLYLYLQEVIAVAKADRRARLYLILAAAVGALVLLYCGSALWGPLFPRSERTYAVQGSVTFQGSPLENGEIEFEPLPGAAQSRTATIKGGTFALQAREGLPRGKTYVLRIRGYRKTGKKTRRGGSMYGMKGGAGTLTPHPVNGGRRRSKKGSRKH